MIQRQATQPYFDRIHRGAPRPVTLRIVSFAISGLATTSMLACTLFSGPDVSGAGRVAWRSPFDSVDVGWQGQPAVADGRAFLFSLRQLRAVSMRDGRLLWKQPPLSETPGEAATLTAVNEMVVATFTNGIHAFNAANGARLWWTQQERDYSSHHPATDGAYLYATSQSRRIDKIALTNGALVWSAEMVSSATGLRAIGVGVVERNDTLFVAGFRGVPGTRFRKAWVAAYNARTGAVFWDSEPLPDRTGAIGRHVLAGDLLIFSDFEGGSVAAVSARSGELVWRMVMDRYYVGPPSGPQLDGRVVYIGAGDVNVYALRVADGSVIWRREIGGAVDNIGQCGNYVMAASTGVQYLLSKRTGAIVADQGRDLPENEYFRSGYAVSNGMAAVSGKDAIYGFRC